MSKLLYEHFNGLALECAIDPELRELAEHFAALAVKYPTPGPKRIELPPGPVESQAGVVKPRRASRTLKAAVSKPNVSQVEEEPKAPEPLTQTVLEAVADDGTATKPRVRRRRTAE